LNGEAEISQVYYKLFKRKLDRLQFQAIENQCIPIVSARTINSGLADDFGRHSDL
jgi:hypothetical protein